MPVEHERTTYVFVGDPRAGNWSVETVDPGQELTDIRVAQGLEEPRVTARVRRRGRRFQLDYTARPIAGQRITLIERGDGVARVLGRARGRRGTVRFRPTLSRDRRRTIEAEVTQNGLPRELLTVARFKAPPEPRLARPRLKAKRSRSTLTLNWRRVRRATRYVVEVSAGSEVLHRLLTPRRRVRFTELPATGNLTVSVEPQSDVLPPGRPARLRLRPRR